MGSKYSLEVWHVAAHKVPIIDIVDNPKDVDNSLDIDNNTSNRLCLWIKKSHNDEYQREPIPEGFNHVSGIRYVIRVQRHTLDTGGGYTTVLQDTIEEHEVPAGDFIAVDVPNLKYNNQYLKQQDDGFFSLGGEYLLSCMSKHVESVLSTHATGEQQQMISMTMEYQGESNRYLVVDAIVISPDNDQLTI
eukprot:GHVR01047078.1.p1 GENE.GHVR01047078.1~~GHVR01047078.1.p1  ORF type:complete len:208 (+),score=39.65 GHVR01047078.1:56-625(+)